MRAPELHMAEDDLQEMAMHFGDLRKRPDLLASLRDQLRGWGYSPEVVELALSELILRVDAARPRIH